MAARSGSLSINSENIFPIIKKWLYSDHDIFFRELVSNGCDAITKLKKLDIKAYTYINTVKESKMQQPELETILKAVEVGSGNKPYEQITTFVSTDLASDKLNAATVNHDDIKDAAEKQDTSDFYESIRGLYFKTATGGSDGAKRTAKEFSDDVFEFLRNGEDSKDSFDKKDLESKGYSSTDIIKALTNNEKTASDLDKAWKKSTKVIEKIEKNINKAISKLKFDDSTNGGDYTKANIVAP